MLLWYVGPSVLMVWYVFRSRGLDFRLIAAGAMVPLVVDLPLGHQAYGHSLVVTVAALAGVMVATIGRRLLRRRWLCLPIGMFCGLLLSGAWSDPEVFWWPFAGGSTGDRPLLPAWWVVLIEEVVGLVACWGAVGLFDLYDAAPRRRFLRTGRLVASDAP